ncbi:hypothetical protein H6G08_34535 [Calothrix anomala FACHB-343]|uniref:Calcium-binding protein n=2 Tax=Calothrix TaxID=1186 RepID=A0ABR8AKH4_9CYAN|nr:hypothetical protein [Calothrix parietina FACHB-288]MBD2229525.1 hypothetical protein [Calothrix anomala FACHB-343]
MANTITGNEANNSLNGGAGADTLFGNTGADTLLGAGGNDYLDGGDGDDNLNGGAGNDTLIGAAGNDILTGADANDVLVGGTENDTISGGLGSDTIRYAFGDGQDRVNGFVTGAGGDFLSFSGIAAIDVFTNTTNGNTVFRVGDGIAGNAGFNQGTLLLTLVGTPFSQADIATNIVDSAGTTFLFS